MWQVFIKFPTIFSKFLWDGSDKGLNIAAPLVADNHDTNLADSNARWLGRSQARIITKSNQCRTSYQSLCCSYHRYLPLVYGLKLTAPW
ncbi:hypothetical protein SBV1_2650002 [Verrucomicrobia bacterium]|nr:hypothetical protein SBV1_2650002 [Verrucomicrobiota bacterium]